MQFRKKSEFFDQKLLIFITLLNLHHLAVAVSRPRSSPRQQGMLAKDTAATVASCGIICMPRRIGGFAMHAEHCHIGPNVPTITTIPLNVFNDIFYWIRLMSIKGSRLLIGLILRRRQKTDLHTKE